MVSELVSRDDIAERLCRSLGLVGDVVAGAQKAERDQQAASRDERDHVADAGEQDLADPNAPVDVARRGRRGGGRSRVTLHAGCSGIGRGSECFGHHLVRFVDRAFDTRCDDGLACEPLPVLDADVGGEDDRVGLGDGVR